MPEQCIRCQYRRNCINGAYCTEHHVYIQYKPSPVCGDYTNKRENNG